MEIQSSADDERNDVGKKCQISSRDGRAERVKRTSEGKQSEGDVHKADGKKRGQSPPKF